MNFAEIVNRWFLDQIACGEIGRFTPAYNQAYAALEVLVARLDAAAQHLTAPAPEPAADAAAPEKE